MCHNDHHNVQSREGPDQARSKAFAALVRIGFGHPRPARNLHCGLRYFAGRFDVNVHWFSDQNECCGGQGRRNRQGESSRTAGPQLPLGACARALVLQGLLLATHVSRPVPVKIPILEFHAVDVRPIPGLDGRQLTLSVSRFQQEMDYLAAQGYTTVTLDQVYAAMQSVVELPSKCVAITFDDGYLDNYTFALPILQAHKFCATFFVVTGAVGRAGFMSWDQLRQMQASGMSIESHTVHHWDLARLTQTELVSELTQSRDAIAAELGQVPSALSYPGGDYSRKVAAAVEAAGYIFAVTNHQGLLMSSMSQFAWPRHGVGDKETLSILAEALEGRLGQKVKHRHT